MQLYITFDCRECGTENRIRTDTAHSYEPHEMLCRNCGHVSGLLEFHYAYRAEHRPRWEREG